MAIMGNRLHHIEANGDVYHCDKYVGDPATT